ncbi:hypothetical protein PHYPSEUDO_007248 [Phytophthora pseudosyringae]|uniref:PPM-type phosphatase domain-containing protein n=1 Tax=Phytophthora pseudosyringae TaxID=221518 RepID=A0A8T1VJV3_9STRA|nr:hypothetical protein PHYPSEUDO_007248 [Phytophthora pseudosyringae]
MLLGRSPGAPRRSVIGSEEFAKVERSSFFGRRLARFLRRSSAVSVATEQSAQNTRGGSASLRPTSGGAEVAAIGAVDPEIAFSVLKPRSFAVCTRNGARLGNEDRFRAIDNLDLYGLGLLEVAPRSVPPSFEDLLQGRVLENFVVEGRAPALTVHNLLKHGRAVEDTQFFGVYDGHGGARASSLLALLFPVYILAAPEYTSDLAAACHSASMAINEEILKREKDGHCEGGATAVTLLIRGNKFVLSNTGDCRAIMVAKRDKVAQVTQLTTDHKASNDHEKQRIEEHGGMVLYVKGVARVNGRLAVARAFGDAELSELVIADPEVTVHELHREDEYIVLASDGLWDVLTNEQVASCIRNNPWLSVQELANMLADRAVELGTMDNVTVLVVDPVMSDRRRKRDSTNSSADDTVKDFNAVDPIQARRRSDYSDHEGGVRPESWMSKVSLAMSSRIFSGGKKLSGSRSTQVMPIDAATTDNSNTSVGPTSSSSLQEMQWSPSPSTSFNGLQVLRHVASERALGSSLVLPSNSSPVSAFGSCPNVTCDVASDNSDDDDRSRWPSHGSAHRRGDSQRRGNSRPQRSGTVVQKVRPGDNDRVDSDEEEEMMVRSTRIRATSISTGILRSRDTGEDANTEINVQDAAPILKGFFSKSVTVSKEQREQQREQRREALYRESKQRQDTLRAQTERDRIASEVSSRKRKVEQLRRLNQQRRMGLLRNAASARKDLRERIQEDNDMYHAERELWENGFEDEMRVLSAAFRKARTSDENRPMTVAGLAVPEAISQLERDASNFEKRVKTAQPALASMTGCQRSTDRPSTSGVSPSSIDGAKSSSPFFESCEVLVLENSKDVFDLFGHDDHASDLFPPKDRNVLVERKQPDRLDIDQLLEEREQLVQRVAAIDRIVQTRQ